MNFETIIGLEVHVELKNDSKIFSPAPVRFGDDPNINTNVIDWGYPGVLPTPNKGVIEYGMRAAVALHAKINQHTHFDRKNYFYPDNPKAYQITQSDIPLAENGWIEINTNGNSKKIGIAEMHIEEDAGKNSHSDNGYSYVDLNRQGTALIEIVSKPDMSSPEEAYDFLRTLRQRIQFTGISDVKMAEGSMRVDVNISIRPFGQENYGTKTELKNINSFNFVRKGLEFEEKRQQQILLRGGTIRPETRRYDENTGKTVLMRVKENSEDYRYFPEPDIPNVDISDDWLNSVISSMPEMPEVRRKHYVDDLGLTDYDAMVLTQTKEMSDFFDETVSFEVDPKLVSNYLQGDVNAYLNDKQVDLQDTKLTPKHLADMIKLLMNETISSKMAKKVFKAITNGEDPNEYVKKNNLSQISDTNQLSEIINNVLNDNEQSIIDYHNGKDRALGFLVGQVMKLTHGQANPKIVNKLLLDELSKR